MCCYVDHCWSFCARCLFGTFLGAVEKMTWSVADCARAWGRSYWAALRLVQRHADEIGAVSSVDVSTGKPAWAVPVGTPCPASSRGNPFFCEPEYQRELVGRRWHPHKGVIDLVQSLRNIRQAQRAEQLSHRGRHR